MFNATFTEVLLVTLAIILLVAAVIDMRTFKISNRLNLCVALLAPVYWWSASMPLGWGIAMQLAMGAAVFGLFAIAFWLGMMGGGDVKLAAALALWFSPVATIRFLVIMSLAGGALTLIVLILQKVRRLDGPPKVPYGVAIAFGGLFILAQRFLNQFS